MSGSPFSLGTRILAGGALLLGLFLGVGFLMPGTWAAERTVTLDVAPAVVFSFVDGPDGWRRWTAWPDSGLVAQGPAQGVGARLVWDDPELGDGSWEIVALEPLTSVHYHVEVQGGSMHTDGTFLLSPSGGGTRITWREEGDFGRNPLMGYWARLMSRAQGKELEKALVRLGELARTQEAPADPEGPADATG